MAYILGQQGFWKLDLEVAPHTLIPRPETELLVERALTLLDPAAGVSVLDLGTGSGAVALAIANERKAARVVATDASKAALGIASRNAARLQATNITLLQGSWYAPVAGQRFDVVISLCYRVREVCPPFPANPPLVHWSMADPAATGSYEAFVATAAELDGRIGFLLAGLAGPPPAALPHNDEETP